MIHLGSVRPANVRTACVSGGEGEQYGEGGGTAESQRDRSRLCVRGAAV